MGLLEECVQIVSLGISLKDALLNDFLDALRLEPGLSHEGSHVSVGSEEGVEDSKLVELDPEIIRGDTKESWYVSATKDYSRNTKSEEHVDGERYVVEAGLGVASPHATVSLGSSVPSF